MKKIQEINRTTLIIELLGEIIQERGELTWAVPFSKEVNLQVCNELLETDFFSVN